MYGKRNNTVNSYPYNPSEGAGGRGAFSLVACLSHLTIGRGGGRTFGERNSTTAATVTFPVRGEGKGMKSLPRLIVVCKTI